MKTFFVRHAESTAQASADRSKNPPLSLNGIEQAKALCIEADTVICSPLLRTTDTLRHSTHSAETIVISETCREIRQGNPCDYFDHEDIEMHETRFQVMGRIQALKEIVQVIRSEKPDEIICIVSHHLFVGLGAGVWLDNCQMVEIDW